MFYLNSNLNFELLPVLVFQLQVYYEVDRLLTGITAQQKGTTARWYSNKTSLIPIPHTTPPDNMPMPNHNATYSLPRHGMNFLTLQNVKI